MLKAGFIVAGLAVAGLGANEILKPSYSHCEHDGDGGAILVDWDNARTSNPGWAVNFDGGNCNTGGSAPDFLSLKSSGTAPA